jgi:glutathione S-transferase
VIPVLLYDSDVSGNCYKVRLLLAQLGLEYERYPMDVVDRSNRQEVLGDLNPGLRVPTLVLDDERPLGESGAILWYLAEGTDYAPTDPYERAKVLQWMFFEQYSHEPYVAVPRFWLTKGIDVDEEMLAERQRVGYLAFDAMESHLAGHAFLVGERYSIADIALYAYTHVAHEGGFDLGRYAAIRAWLDRVAAQPGHVPITA